MSGTVGGRRRPHPQGGWARGVVALLLLALAALVPTGPAAAHAPHDDIFAVVVSPEVEEDGVVHALSRGFLMRSTDAGVTWHRVVDGLSNRVGLVALAGAPDDAAVLHAASEEGAVFRSGDGGSGWSRVGSLPDGVQPTAFVVGPADGAAPRPVYATTVGEDLLRSDDGGATWQVALATGDPVAGVALGPTGDQVWAVDHGGSLHTSGDGGRTWRSDRVAGAGHLTSVLALPDGGGAAALVGTGDGQVVRVDGAGGAERDRGGLPDEAVVGLAATGKGDDLVVYASTSSSGAFRSDDGGRTWSARDDGLTTDEQRDEPEYADRPDFGPIVAADVGVGDDLVFVGGFDGLFRSTDGAASWTEVETIPATTVVGLALSPAFAEDATILVTTYLNGAHVSRRGPDVGALERRPGGARPVRRRHRPLRPPLRPGLLAGLPRRRHPVHHPAPRPAALDRPGADVDGGRGAGHAAERRRPQLRDGGAGARRGRAGRRQERPDPPQRGRRPHARHRGGRGGAGAVARRRPRRPAGAPRGTRAGVATSRDGGETWDAPSSDQSWAVTTLAVGAAPGGTVLLAGTPRGLRVSPDGGRTWSLAGLGPGSDRAIEGVVASPAFAEDGTVLVSVRGEGLFRSTDRGRTFEPVAPSLGPEQRIPTSYSKPTSSPIAFSPTFATDRTVVASVGPEVLVSTDGGDTWTATEIDAATHPPVDDEATGAGGWGRRRIAAAGAAGVAVLAVGAVGVVLLTRRRRRPPPAGASTDGGDPSAHEPTPPTP